MNSLPVVEVLLPLKILTSAKSRLAPLLPGEVRSALTRAMAQDVMAVLTAHPAVARVNLISDDPEAPVLAAGPRLRHLSERALMHQGQPPDLNSLLTAACEQLQWERRGHPSLTLVLHADLPQLTAADIDAALALYASCPGLVVACDWQGSGTNLLLFDSAAPPVFSFGSGSCALHQRRAREAVLPVQLLRRPGLARDVDTGADWRALLRAPPATVGEYTRRYLMSLTDSARAQLPTSDHSQTLPTHLLAGAMLSDEHALELAACDDTPALVALAGRLRDRGHRDLMTYSRKVFIPLTQLCRDVCHYCTFARTPKKIRSPFMPVEEVLALCREGAALGCQEALFTLGEKPELRYRAAREALAEMGFDSTLDYLRTVAGRVLRETGLLPHINAGCMDAQDIAALRQVSASMGIMLESASTRLCEKGMPHHGSPDKVPVLRLRTIELAGEAKVPFTSGILIGIGETRRERIEALLALRALHRRHGHLQEVIIQNFRAKPGTRMAQSPEPELDELLWTIAVARLLFGPTMNIQAPPNLSPGVLPQLVAAGINDWGGVSPLTPDHVNPEAPWPHLDQLAQETAAAGKFLEQRLTIYPAYLRDPSLWLDPAVRGPVLRQQDAGGYARRDSWTPGEDAPVPPIEARLLQWRGAVAVAPELRAIAERCEAGAELSEAEVERLFECRGDEFNWLIRTADRLRRERCGDTVRYVVNRNINYTNVCYFKCEFCAFSKGKLSEQLRGRPYDISATEIARRCREAWQRGATEVCMQGGIHPDYTGQTYLDILATVRAATPNMHIHAFSPLEVWQGAATLGLPLETYLQQLRDAGLDTLPGTAAEILDDEVRALLCPDKLNTGQWLEVMETAHRVGFRTTATIMYGHVEQPRHWARHLLAIRRLQARTGGFTELVPLPFVHMEAPMYQRGRARRGPSFREAVMMHAVARLVLHRHIDNIQVSWVKMGEAGVAACLQAGANDLGGTLMNESITRAAGSTHGQEWSPARMEARIRAAGRTPRMRTTLYGEPPAGRREAAFAAPELLAVDNASAGRRQRDKRLLLPDGPRSATSAAEQVVLMAASI